VDAWGGLTVPNPAFYAQRQRAVIDKLVDAGLI
jgi:hypothetical protein